MIRFKFSSWRSLLMCYNMCNQPCIVGILCEPFYHPFAFGFIFDNETCLFLFICESLLLLLSNVELTSRKHLMSN